MPHIECLVHCDKCDYWFGKHTSKRGSLKSFVIPGDRPQIWEWRNVVDRCRRSVSTQRDTYDSGITLVQLYSMIFEALAADKHTDVWKYSIDGKETPTSLTLTPSQNCVWPMPWLRMMQKYSSWYPWWVSGSELYRCTRGESATFDWIWMYIGPEWVPHLPQSRRARKYKTGPNSVMLLESQPQVHKTLTYTSNQLPYA